MKKLILATIVFIFAIFTLSSCKSDINIESPTANIDAIKSKGKIVMLTNAEFPPFEYVGKKGNIEGIDIDVANEIASDLGVELEVIDMNFDFLIESIKSNKGDFAAAGLTITPEREQQVYFSIKYITSSQYMIVKNGSTLTPDELYDATIAVQESTKGDFYATDEIECKNILRFKSAIEAGQALISGKCDAVILDELPAYSIVNTNPNKIQLFEEPLTSESYAFAIKKGKDDLLEAINSTLSRLVRDGKIEEFLINSEF